MYTKDIPRNDLYKLQLEALASNNIIKLSTNENRNKDDEAEVIPEETTDYKINHHNVNIADKIHTNPSGPIDKGITRHIVRNLLKDISPGDYFDPEIMPHPNKVNKFTGLPEHKHELKKITINNSNLSRQEGYTRGIIKQIANSVSHHIHNNGTDEGKILDDYIGEHGVDFHGNDRKSIERELGEYYQDTEFPVQDYTRAILRKVLEHYNKYRDDFRDSYDSYLQRASDEDEEVYNYPEDYNHNENYYEMRRENRIFERASELFNNARMLTLPEFIENDTDINSKPLHIFQGLHDWLRSHVLIGLHHIHNY